MRLLRSYRGAEWDRWFEAAGLRCPALRGPVPDSSVVLAEMAAQGLGVGLLPARMFRARETGGRLVRPFDLTVDLGSYWLTWPQSRPESQVMRRFRLWLTETAPACDTA
ncbi:LysR substrate-binding domain-containing protein [Mangrovicoccus algicola]|uniref:LysR substrate-binding domain-containing protein n=1 Tax=Mangrovicoccus algicola TaxID=2771008 RepID=UPI002ED98728